MTTPDTHHPVTAGPAGRRPAGAGPSLERLLGLVARAALEIRAGRRPLRQLRGLVSPAVEHRLRSQLPRPHRPAAPAPRANAVRSVCAGWPFPGVCEATVLIEGDGRVTALALRAELHDGIWRIVEIAAPEGDLAPLRTPGPVGPRPASSGARTTGGRDSA